MLTMSDFNPVKSAFKIYPASLHEENDSCVFIADIGDRDVLVAAGPAAACFTGTALTAGDVPYVCCELVHENADALRKLFPFAAGRAGEASLYMVSRDEPDYRAVTPEEIAGEP